MAMQQQTSEPSPRPWKLHNTGGYIAIIDAAGDPVIRKTTNTLGIEQYVALRANFEFIIRQCNLPAGQ